MGREVWTGRRRKFWGWGTEDQDLSPEEQSALARRLEERFGVRGLEPAPPPRIEEIELPPGRLTGPKAPPRSLAGILSEAPFDRAAHTYGKAFRDVVRAFERDFSPAPDLVAFPESEQQVAELLDWCSEAGVAAIPYGGGSSVVAGVEPDVGPGYAGAVSIDLCGLDRVLEVDPVSRAARIEGGIYGPALEAALKPHGLTLRHFPQSFEFSTLGGWIATRSGGHYATLYTHVDDFVESLRVVTPDGVAESFRLPGSGAGPSPDRFFIGSEGAFGIITSAWMRLQHRPTFRANASIVYPDFMQAAEAVRLICQAGLHPANVRILDESEALINGVADGSVAVMVLGFESADHPVDAWMSRALEIARDCGGSPAEAADDETASRRGMAGQWRDAFIRMPYYRDAMVGMGLLSETFETAITWDRFPAFHERVMSTLRDALARVAGGGSVSCRFTHAYPDGPAPYYSVSAPGRRGGQLAMMEEIKTAVSDAIVEGGGTITHHHAVGRYHHPWYVRQRPEPFGRALAGAKAVLDPAGVMNPGVIVDPRPRSG